MPRRESDAQQMQNQSLAADDIALAKITRDVQGQAAAEEQRQSAADDTPQSNTETSSPDSDDSTLPDADFHKRMSAVRGEDIEEIQTVIRSDPDYSIRQESGPAAATPSGPSRSDTIEEQSTTGDSSRKNTDIFPDTHQLNPTHDQQYTMHQGSRGISPPPGFEDTAIPPYLDAPSYQNIISQPPGLPIPPPALALRPNDTLPEADRPSITDKFMDAHIARHGNVSLSPLALVTPDQADMLPEYHSSEITFEDDHAMRGRGRQERSLQGFSQGDEISKTMDALEDVRAYEEREAIEAIEAMEELRLTGAGQFDDEQLAAMQSVGDDPSNYFSADELLQFQRLASDSANEEGQDNYADEENERELLEMMAQYVRRPTEVETMTTAELDAQDEIDEMENMLRDRLLTTSIPSPERRERIGSQNPQSSTDARQVLGAQFPGVAFRATPEILAIFREAREVSIPVADSDSRAEEDVSFGDPSSRTGVDLQAVAGAALARSVAATEQDQETAKQSQNTSQQQAGFGGGHGVKRTTLDPAAYAAKVARNEQKAQAYLALSEQVSVFRLKGDYSIDALNLTMELLLLNPEYYTIWNYRREIMLQGLFPNSDDTTKQNILDKELKTLQDIMKDFPKVYWIWNHRKWCLSQIPWPDWSRELLLVTKMLERDARNFHVWEYRRYVVAQIEKAEESSKAQREFEYTTAAINSNFSNFSAWHNRTKLIPQILSQVPDADDRDQRRRELLKDELELIKGAIYTDPDDQSVWLYHRWLVNPDSADGAMHPLAPTTKSEHIEHLNREMEMIDELLEEEPENVWCTYAKVHYALSLQRLTEDESNMGELRDLISSLEKNDDLRAGRYTDWHSSTLSQNPSSTPGKAIAGTAPEFLIFSDLKGRQDWSDVTLNDKSYLTATNHANDQSTKCVIFTDMNALLEFRRTNVWRDEDNEPTLVVSDVSNGGIEYFKISKFC